MMNPALIKAVNNRLKHYFIPDLDLNLLISVGDRMFLGMQDFEFAQI